MEMNTTSNAPERHANPELRSAWDRAYLLEPGFSDALETQLAQEVRSARVRCLPSWLKPASAAAAAVLLGWGIAEFATTKNQDPCVTFACLWDKQQDLPLTEDELMILDRWESGYDEDLF